MGKKGGWKLPLFLTPVPSPCTCRLIWDVVCIWCVSLIKIRGESLALSGSTRPSIRQGGGVGVCVCVCEDSVDRSDRNQTGASSHSSTGPSETVCMVFFEVTSGAVWHTGISHQGADDLRKKMQREFPQQLAIKIINFLFLCSSCNKRFLCCWSASIVIHSYLVNTL